MEESLQQSEEWPSGSGPSSIEVTKQESDSTAITKLASQVEEQVRFYNAIYLLIF